MSIDRIGKKPGVLGADSPEGVSSASTKKTFEVKPASSVSASESVSPADRVRTGDMDIHAYVEHRVNEATQHLQGKLSASDLDKVKDHLRSQIAEDPAIREMVKAATGVLPPSDEG